MRPRRRRRGGSSSSPRKASGCSAKKRTNFNSKFYLDTTFIFQISCNSIFVFRKLIFCFVPASFYDFTHFTLDVHIINRSYALAKTKEAYDCPLKPYYFVTGSFAFHSSSATSTTNLSFAHCCSSVSLFP